MRMRVSSVAATAVLVFAGGSRAQVEDGTYLLSNYKGGHSSFNDVWGYASGGREIAILGDYDEAVFVETTDPFNPVELTSIGHSGSTWGDMDVLGTYCYVVNESGGGLQIIDMSDLDNIVLVKNLTDWFYTAHNVSIDPTASVLYAPGSNSGMPQLSLTDPENPTYLGRHAGDYSHDAIARNGFLHSAEIYAGTYRIMDVSAPGSFPTVDVIVTPGSFTHNVAINDAETVAITTDESGHGHLGLYDISDKADIQYLGEYSSNFDGIVHNTFIVGDTAHCSYYEEGYIAVDISDPTRPVKIAQLDTFTGADGNYDGVWGCYPSQPSGVIYISDRSNGLYVLTLATQIDFTPLPDTEDTGPYTLSATITPPSPSAGVSSATLYYRNNSGAFNSAAMSPGPGPNEWLGDIPAQLKGSTVEYYVEAVDDIGQARNPRQDHQHHLFSVGAQSVFLVYDFDGATDESWTHGASQGTDDWTRGKPYVRSGDPGHSVSGQKCWATDLGRSSDGEYEPDSSSWLQSPYMNLGGVSGGHLRFERWLNLDLGDTARLLVEGAEVWSVTGPLFDEAWTTVDFDVSALVDDNSSVTVRFELVSDSFDNSGGWNIDDFEIYELEQDVLSGIFLSLQADSNVGGIASERTDVLRLDTSAGTYSMHFDGSDVGLSGNPNTDAIEFLDDGSMILSFAQDGVNVPGVGTVDDSDLVQFFPTAWGDNTAGSFAMYFDGSDVLLGTNGEDISGVSVDSSGDIHVTTKGRFDVAVVSGKNEDVLLFAPTSLGANTSGTWSLLFDGSSAQVKLAKRGEQLNAYHYREQQMDMVMTTSSDFRVPKNLTGQNDDLLLFTPTLLGSPTEGSFSLLLDGALFGLDPENIGGLVYLQ